MSDESKVGRNRVDFEHDRDVRDWCQSHGITADELHDAVKEIQNFIATLEILVDRRADASMNDEASPACDKSLS